MAELTITKDNFEKEVMQAELPVMLDFWASWCGPCQMLSPIVEELADEYDGKVTVGKVNVDDERALAMQFGIASIPTVVLMQKGEIVASLMGYRPKEDWVALLQKVL